MTENLPSAQRNVARAIRSATKIGDIGGEIFYLSTATAYGLTKQGMNDQSIPVRGSGLSQSRMQIRTLDFRSWRIRARLLAMVFQKLAKSAQHKERIEEVNRIAP